MSDPVPDVPTNPCGCKFVCRHPDSCPRPDLTAKSDDFVLEDWDDDAADDEDLFGFQGWTRGGTPIQEF